MGGATFAANLIEALVEDHDIDEESAKLIADKARSTVTEISAPDPLDTPLATYLKRNLGTTGWIVDRIENLNGETIAGRWNQLVVMYEMHRYVTNFEPRIEGTKPYPLTDDEKPAKAMGRFSCEFDCADTDGS